MCGYLSTWLQPKYGHGFQDCLVNRLVFWFYYLRDVVSLVLATATWLAGWVAVCHSRYCIKTTKPILKLFRPSDSPIIEAFGTPCADTKFQGNPSVGVFNTWGWENGRFSCNFQRKSPFISETVRDRPMVTMER